MIRVEQTENGLAVNIESLENNQDVYRIDNLEKVYEEIKTGAIVEKGARIGFDDGKPVKKSTIPVDGRIIETNRRMASAKIQQTMAEQDEQAAVIEAVLKEIAERKVDKVKQAVQEELAAHGVMTAADAKVKSLTKNQAAELEKQLSTIRDAVESGSQNEPFGFYFSSQAEAGSIPGLSFDVSGKKANVGLLQQNSWGVPITDTNFLNDIGRRLDDTSKLLTGYQKVNNWLYGTDLLKRGFNTISTYLVHGDHRKATVSVAPKGKFLRLASPMDITRVEVVEPEVKKEGDKYVFSEKKVDYYIVHANWFDLQGYLLSEVGKHFPLFGKMLLGDPDKQTVIKRYQQDMSIYRSGEKEFFFWLRALSRSVDDDHVVYLLMRGEGEDKEWLHAYIYYKAEIDDAGNITKPARAVEVFRIRLFIPELDKWRTLTPDGQARDLPEGGIYIIPSIKEAVANAPIIERIAENDGGLLDPSKTEFTAFDDSNIGPAVDEIPLGATMVDGVLQPLKDGATVDAAVAPVLNGVRENRTSEYNSNGVRENRTPEYDIYVPGVGSAVKNLIFKARGIPENAKGIMVVFQMNQGELEDHLDYAGLRFDAQQPDGRLKTEKIGYREIPSAYGKKDLMDVPVKIQKKALVRNADGREELRAFYSTLSEGLEFYRWTDNGKEFYGYWVPIKERPTRRVTIAGKSFYLMEGEPLPKGMEFLDMSNLERADLIWTFKGYEWANNVKEIFNRNCRADVKDKRFTRLVIQDGREIGVIEFASSLKDIDMTKAGVVRILPDGTMEEVKGMPLMET
ncbi:MAG TPA: hypothetical protein VLJ10_04340, partial [Candidatus Bathyarchaeia archaeon]|nr:hypothetical protein [Candidatus Bathyarchaeia archaeon]